MEWSSFSKALALLVCTFWCITILFYRCVRSNSSSLIEMLPTSHAPAADSITPVFVASTPVHVPLAYGEVGVVMATRPPLK
eukprot:COSAG02_NODE_254_length_26937_cov_16.503950_12_plen_81_part_00